MYICVHAYRCCDRQKTVSDSETGISGHCELTNLGKGN